jgi:hypothetical protein
MNGHTLSISTLKKFSIVLLLFFIAGFAGAAHADLNDSLRRINEQAKADMKNFNVKLSAQFNIPVPQVDAVLKIVATPADAFMVLQLGQMANKQPEVVVKSYQANRNKGWGVIAKELGIKPGSAEFHALKRGDFVLTGKAADNEDQGPGKGKGKGHGKGHNK